MVLFSTVLGSVHAMRGGHSELELGLATGVLIATSVLRKTSHGWPG